MLEAPVETPVPAETTDPETGQKPENRGKRSVKKRKNRFFMVKLVCGWLAVLALIVFGARKMWPEQKPDRSPVTGTASATPVVADVDVELLNEAGQKCVEAFSGYLAAGTPEQRNQFVLNPISTASRMVLFYSMNPITAIDPATLGMVGSGVLHLPGARTIETQWSSKDGKILDAVFREENGEWRLDWDYFVRYSDYPWSLFLAGSGEPEGEFRLLARERLAEERKNEETISLVLYAPRFGHPRETGFQSPEFLISRRSRDGQLLDAAFKLARSGKQVFNSKLPDTNPDDMIRLRLKVKRTEVEMDRKFEITGITACHWYSVDEPGVEPAEPTEEKPPGN